MLQLFKYQDQEIRFVGTPDKPEWQQAYSELDYRFGYPIAKSRAKNKLEKVEADGQIDNLLAVMRLLWD